MSITSITLVDSDLSTVLFDLHDPTGANNSSWGSVATKFALGGSFKVTAPHEAGRFPRTGSDGAFTTFSRRGLGTAEWRQFISGTTEANLRLGTGRLADLITRGTIFRIVTSTTTRYLRLEPSGYPTPYQGKESELADLFAAFKFQQGIDVSAACQPYWEGAEVSVSGVTVPNDPATSTKVRVFPVTGVTGDLPTQGKVRVQMDTGSTVERVLIAARARNDRASTFFSDYLNSTGFLQCEATGRGWTITLGTDTTGQTVATASPGSGTSVARVSYATNANMVRRVRAERTSALDSLRGAWDVYARFAPSAVSTHILKLAWGPSTAATPSFSETPITFEIPSDAINYAYFTEKKLGRIYIPETVALGGLTLEVHTQRSSGTGNLDLDFLWLVPADNNSTVVVPGASEYTILGQEFATAVSNPAGGTAGDIPAGTTALRLDATTENAGVPPNAGTVLAAGRYQARVTLRNVGTSTATVDFIIRNITGSTNTNLVAVTLTTGQTKTAYLSFTADGTSAYQEQVDNPSSGDIVYIESFTRQFQPSLGLNESTRSDPSRLAVDRLDSSGNIAGYLGVEGAVPVTLEPGDNHLMVRCDDIAKATNPHNENVLGRTPTVSVVYSPRFGL